VTADPRRGPALPDPLAIEDALAVVPGVARVEVHLGDAVRPGVLRIVLGAGGDADAVAALARRILRLQFGVSLDPDLVEVVENVEHPVSYLRLVETDETGAVVVGEDIDRLLATLDTGPGPRFDTDVLASAVRHPAGVMASNDGHSRLPAQGRPRVAEPSPASDQGRVAVGGLTLESDDLGILATVTLHYDGRDWVGAVEGAPSPAALHRSVAGATLRALDGLLPPDIRLEVDAVSMMPIGDGTVAVARVIWVSAEGTGHLTGSSEVRDDPREAVIRATLDAVNRRLHVELVER
jgi:hypothetical protein